MTQTTKLEDHLMDEATEITKEVQSLIDDGLFPFNQVRILIWESFRKLVDEQNKKWNGTHD